MDQHDLNCHWKHDGVWLLFDSFVVVECYSIILHSCFAAAAAFLLSYGTFVNFTLPRQLPTLLMTPSISLYVCDLSSLYDMFFLAPIRFTTLF